MNQVIQIQVTLPELEKLINRAVIKAIDEITNRQQIQELNLKQACKYLRISFVTLKNHINQGNIRTLGGKKITIDELDRVKNLIENEHIKSTKKVKITE